MKSFSNKVSPGRCRGLFILCLAGVGCGSIWADQITLKNGDRVTGSVVKKDAKTVTIKSEHFGVITTNWDQVASVRIDAPVTVVLQDGKSVQGTVTTADGNLVVATTGAKVTAAPAQVTTIRNADEQKAYERLLKPGLGELWAGNATVGLAGSAGNARTLTFTTGVTAARVTNTDKTSLYFNIIKSSALVNGKSADTAQAVRGGLGYDHNVSPRLFINTFNDWEYDRFQNLDLRFVIGGGFGFHAVKNERSVLDLLGGIAYDHASYNTPLTRNSAEFYWGDTYNYKMNSKTSLVQSYRMFDDLTNRGTYRINFDLGLSTKVAKWLDWNVSFSDRYLNHPAPGRKTNDLLYTTGLGITFAR